MVSDLAQRIAGGSGSILLLSVTGRLTLVLDLLLSGAGRHWHVGLGVVSKVSSAHVGHSDVFAAGGDVGNSCCLTHSGCLDGPLISL